MGLLAPCVVMVGRGADVNEVIEEPIGGTRPLHVAAAYDRVSIVRFLIEQGAKIEAVDEQGQTALMWAAAQNSLGAAEALLAYGKADPAAVDNRHCSVYSIAAQLNNLAMLHLLHMYKPMQNPENDVDVEGHGLLVWAAYMGSFSVMRYLHEFHHIQLAPVDLHKRTPLHWAAREGATDVCAYMVSRGNVPLDHRDADGRTAYEWAIAHKHARAALAIRYGIVVPPLQSGTLRAVASRIDLGAMAVFGILLVLIGWFVLPHLVSGLWIMIVGGPIIVVKFYLYSSLYPRSIMHSTSNEPTLVDVMRPPTSFEEMFAGLEQTRWRDPMWITGLSLLIALVVTRTHGPWLLLISLAVLMAVCAFAVKQSCLADILPEGPMTLPGGKRNPVLAAVEHYTEKPRVLQHLRDPRVYSERHLQHLPQRSFVCREMDTIIRRFESWSLLLDAPISHTNRRWYALFLLIGTLLGFLALVSSWIRLSFAAQCHLPRNQSFLISLLQGFLFWSLPCAPMGNSVLPRPPLIIPSNLEVITSWLNWLKPHPLSIQGTHGILIPGFILLLFGFLLVRQLRAAWYGCSLAELAHGTIRTRAGEVQPLFRSDGQCVFSLGSGGANLRSFWMGRGDVGEELLTELD